MKLTTSILPPGMLKELLDIENFGRHLDGRTEENEVL
jgi:hypothetical protein